MLSASEIKQGLNQFYGTENYYKHWLGMKFTDGVHYLAEAAGAFWLIDAVASHQPNVLRKGGRRLQDFQLWTLKKKPTKTYPNGCILECRGDSDEAPIVTQKIGFTDFPLDEITLYVENGIILLPGEH